MKTNDLKLRTKRFALRVLKMVDTFPKTSSGRIFADQLGRAATSVGANYRAACRARSRAEFIAKLGLVEEESDECGNWIELASESGAVSAARIEPLLREAGEITAIIIASIKSARSNGERRSAGTIPQSAIRNPK